jgi:hypothetical protein
MGTEPREELKAKQFEKVIYFAANMVVWVDEDKRHDDLTTLEAELVEERRTRWPNFHPSLLRCMDCDRSQLRRPRRHGQR